MVTRCCWAEHDELRVHHDEEWGVPVHDDARLFELLTLEGARAGLSWLIVLRRRDGYRVAFGRFDPEVVAAYMSGAVDRLVENPAIIRHLGKIESAVSNAEALLELQRQGTSLDEILWSFVDGSPVVHNWPNDDPLPASTPAATAMSKEQGAQATGLPVRRADHMLRVDAGGGPGQRPPSGVFPSGRAR